MNVRALISELRRRHVFRTAGAYSVVAWLLVQITDLAAPHLGLPQWSVPLLIVAVAVGFPLTLILAWTFDLTREGVVGIGRSESARSPRTGSRPGRQPPAPTCSPRHLHRG